MANQDLYLYHNSQGSKPLLAPNHSYKIWRTKTFTSIIILNGASPCSHLTTAMRYGEPRPSPLPQSQGSKPLFTPNHSYKIWRTKTFTSIIILNGASPCSHLTTAMRYGEPRPSPLPQSQGSKPLFTPNHSYKT